MGSQGLRRDRVGEAESQPEADARVLQRPRYTFGAEYIRPNIYTAMHTLFDYG